METPVYLDHSATTPLRPEVREAMLPFLEGVCGNPSSVHRHGRAARHALDAAREQVATHIGAHPSEIIFTGSGTEANNLAIHGPRATEARSGIVISTIEHHSVMYPAETRAKRHRATLKKIGVDRSGRLDREAFADSLTPDTLLASVMLVNNETGTIQDIESIAAMCRERGILFHTDAVQAAATVPINVIEYSIDLLTLSGHKLNGPKGVGALYVRRGTRLNAQLSGGPQERGYRAGTENVAGIVGFGKACALAIEYRDENARHLAELRDVLEREIMTAFPNAIVNGDRKNRSPHILNVSIPGHDGERLLLGLDARSIAVSTGSACTAGSLDPSHVLLAMGLDHATAQSALRFSLGLGNTPDDIHRTITALQALSQAS